MSNAVYTRRPAETLGSDTLAELALDLRWSFNHAADTIWQRLDPVLWNLTHIPCRPCHEIDWKRSLPTASSNSSSMTSFARSETLRSRPRGSNRRIRTRP